MATGLLPTLNTKKLDQTKAQISIVQTIKYALLSALLKVF